MSEEKKLDEMVPSAIREAIAKVHEDALANQRSLQLVSDLLVKVAINLVENAHGLPEIDRIEIQSKVDVIKKEILSSRPHSWTPAWIEIESTPVLKIKNFPRVDVPQKSDLLEYLKKSKIGKIYSSHLKKVNIIRLVVMITWRELYPFFINNIYIPLSRNRKKRWRKLIKYADFVSHESLENFVIIREDQVLTPFPIVIPASEKNYLTSPHDAYVFPEVSCAVFENSTICDTTNLIFKDDVVVMHDLYNFELDYTSEELHRRAIIQPSEMKIRWLDSQVDTELIPDAAIFLDSCAPNYAHWLTEVLPRIVIFCSNINYAGIPIVVNEGLHKNIMQSLAHLVGDGREVITLKTGGALAVSHLYVTSVAGYVPFERRTIGSTLNSHGIFSPSAFQMMQKKYVDFNALRGKKFPKKIFIRRNSNVRNLVNAVEVENLLIKYQFEIIEPEKLSFMQQVNIFSQAEIIVGVSGAALANIIFAPSGAKICIMIGKTENTSYWYWQNIACASGKKTITYILGDSKNVQRDGIHSCFQIDVETLEKEFLFEHNHIYKGGADTESQIFCDLEKTSVVSNNTNYTDHFQSGGT